MPQAAAPATRLTQATMERHRETRWPKTGIRAGGCSCWLSDVPLCGSMAAIIFSTRLSDTLSTNGLIIRLISEHFDWVWISNILATLVTALLFTPLRDGLYRRVTRLLYPYRITVGEALNHLIEAARQAGQTPGDEIELPAVLCSALEDMLYLEKVFIWFYFPATGDLQLAGYQDIQPAHIPLSGVSGWV